MFIHIISPNKIKSDMVYSFDFEFFNHTLEVNNTCGFYIQEPDNSWQLQSTYDPTLLDKVLTSLHDLILVQLIGLFPCSDVHVLVLANITNQSMDCQELRDRRLSQSMSCLQLVIKAVVNK